MDHGRVAELDEPATLLRNKDSMFCSLVGEMGCASADHLTELAEEKARERAAIRARDHHAAGVVKEEVEEPVVAEAEADVPEAVPETVEPVKEEKIEEEEEEAVVEALKEPVEAVPEPVVEEEEEEAAAVEPPTPVEEEEEEAVEEAEPEDIKPTTDDGEDGEDA
jgi:hypothetical protein